MLTHNATNVERYYRGSAVVGVDPALSGLGLDAHRNEVRWPRRVGIIV